MKRLIIFSLLLLPIISFAQRWNFSETLLPQNIASSDMFGNKGQSFGEYYVVSAQNERLDVNEQNAISQSGKVYVYKYSAATKKYALIKQLVAPDRQLEGTYLNFGNAVAINNNYIMVGAIGSDYDGNGQNYLRNSGAVYVFGKNVGGADNWGFVKKLIDPINRQQNNSGSFGYQIALTDSLMAVADPYDPEVIGNSSNGGVHVFKINKGGVNNWGYENSTFRESPASGGGWLYGYQIKITNTHLIISAPNYKVYYNGNGGRIYIYKMSYNSRGALVLNNRTLLEATRDFDINYFGESIEISNSLLVAGARNDDLDQNGGNRLVNSGAAYVYELSALNTWTLKAKIVPPIRQSNQFFGESVEIVNDTIIISAYEQDTFGVDSNRYDAGAVFTFIKGANATVWNYKGHLYQPNYFYKIRKFGGNLEYDGTRLFVTSGYLWSAPTANRVYIYSAGNSGQVQVDTTIWNGLSWDNGTPTNNMVAIIEDDITISSTTVCKTLVFNNTPSITINAGQELEVRGDLVGAASFSGSGKLLIANTFSTVTTNAALTVNNLEINNTYNLELGGNITVNGALTLTNGHIVLGAYNMIVPNNTTFSGGSSDSYIRISGTGKLQVTHTRGDARFFPIGYNPYLPIEIEIPAAGNFDNRTYEIGLTDGLYENPETQSTLQNANAVNKTWFVNPTAVASNVSVTVYWPVATEMVGFNRALSSLSYWFQGFGSWVNQSFAPANGTDPYNKTVTGVYFSPYADLWFGVGSAGSALPVEMTFFDVSKNTQKEAVLNWQTAMEENNSHFEIQRSFDATNWEQIGQVAGQGSTFSTSDYQFIDADLESKVQNLRSGKHATEKTSDIKFETIYYRLKQVDHNGNFEYSDVRSLNFDVEALNTFKIWPNPVNGASFLNTSILGDYKIYSSSGVLLIEYFQTNKIDVSILENGSYIIKNETEYQIFNKQ